ncbi:MAG: IPT/TIG domain-containing protein [Chitinophagaceae bacterium]|nr:IPT/TIG domain-containing protein [Chitinophagaceae bacterium]
MKTFNLALICLLLGGGACFYSCSKSNSGATTTTPPPPPPPPVISSISPDSGVLGTTVTISGSGFSANIGDNLVKFNDSIAIVSSASATQLTVKVPVSAGTGPVSVTVGGKTATGPTFNYAYTVTVSTLAGSSPGYADGNGAAAKFGLLQGICVDKDGNIYVADYGNSMIRKVTPSGGVGTFAGSTRGYADGDGLTAQFNYPMAVCVDGQGNVYVADADNNRIRKITPAGTVSTVAGGTLGYADGSAATAQFYRPSGICIDGKGNLYVSDFYNNKIRKITPAGVVSTLAGSSQGFADGNGAVAQFNGPMGTLADSLGNVYVADMNNDKIRKITPSGVVSTLAGSSHGYAEGNALTAQFRWPAAVCLDGKGNFYVADNFNNKIRKITPAGIVSRLAGSTTGTVDGDASTAMFDEPYGICIDSHGIIYTTDEVGYRIRKIVIQ